MPQLPEEFCTQTRQVMGEERFQRYLESFTQEPPVSIRLNPKKCPLHLTPRTSNFEPVPWCRDAYYLRQRPNFTMDPLFHAGCYYVQEAASMFLDEIIRTSPTPSEGGEKSPSPSGRLGEVLDLCAAPGGKSTLLRAALPDDCVLYSNEPIRQRASILLENVEKWGYDNHIVTNNYPRDYRRSKLQFDLILCDVPCSGEGMFRKDEATIREWSPQQVEKCWRLQREIVDDAWACLAPGGLLVYSTCTFNTKENEENVRYFLEQYDDMEVVPVAVRPEWHVTGSLLPGFTAPVYRFIPGITRTEGLFMCVLRKRGTKNEFSSRNEERGARNEFSSRNEERGARNENSLSADNAALKVTSPPHSSPPRSSKQKDSSKKDSPKKDSPEKDLTYPQAIAYLRGEALQLPPDTPRGLITVTFMGQPLGQVKNIGTRANNLYPKEWRIRTTHVPQEYEPVLDV